MMFISGYTVSDTHGTMLHLCNCQTALVHVAVVLEFTQILDVNKRVMLLGGNAVYSTPIKV